jgi:tetratricopeptide (TPR) repeat protein
VKSLGAPWLVVVASIAVVAATADSISWLSWRSITASLEVNPGAAAETMATSPLMSLPTTAVRSRRLAVSELQGAAVESIVGALTRVGALQRRWMPVEGVGFVNLAREEFLRGHPRESVDALAAALDRDPTSAYLHRLQALFLFSLGDRQSALAELAVAEAIAPGLRRPEVELTADDARRVRLDGLRRRQEYYPRRKMESALALARELRIEGDPEGAHALLAELRGRAEVEIEIARWAIEAGEYPAALESLLPVAERRANPRAVRSRAWSMVAIARDLDGDREGSLSAAREALDLDPDSPAPYVTLAGLAQGRGDLDGALEHLRRAWGMKPTDTGLLTRIAAVAEQAGRSEDALLALERAVEINPDSALLASRLVELQLRRGRYAEAAATLSEALDRNPTDAALLRLADRLPREVGIR